MGNETVAHVYLNSPTSDHPSLLSALHAELWVDDRGKVKLSMRAVDHSTGEEVPVERKDREPRRERRPRNKND